MPPRTVNVADSGGDYTTLNSALSTENKQLVDNTRLLTINCKHFHDSTAASTGGSYQNNTSYYIKICGDPTEITSSNRGKWAADRYTLEVAGNCLTIFDNNTRVEDLQIHPTNGSKSIRVEPYAGPTFIDRCIMYGVTSDFCYGIYSAVGTTTVRNCIAYDFANAGNYNSGFAITGGTLVISNCTSHNCSYGQVQYSGTATSKNCGASGSSTASYGTWTSDLHTGDPTFVGHDAKNFHLDSADTTWLGHGADLSADGYSDDIDGETRSGTWDVGADQHAAAAPSLSILKVMRYYRALRAA